MTNNKEIKKRIRRWKKKVGKKYVHRGQGFFLNWKKSFCKLYLTEHIKAILKEEERLEKAAKAAKLAKMKK